MNSLLEVLSEDSTPEELARGFEQYRTFLISAKDRFPSSAYEFATASWHYDHSDHRCPHDSWVETIVVGEPWSGTRREIRSLEITIRY